MTSASNEQDSVNVEDDGLEATELSSYEDVGRSTGTSASLVREDYIINDGHLDGISHYLSISVKNFWRRQVAATVQHEACRDHFGKWCSLRAVFLKTLYHPCIAFLAFFAFNPPPSDRALTSYSLSYLAALERTFLGYLRTSFALSVVAVLIAQLFRLEHTDDPNKTLGFFVIGIPLACVCIVAAIIVLLLGAYRFWRQQNAMLRGKVHAGGWEINAIGVTITMVRSSAIYGLRCLLMCSGHAYTFCTLSGS